MLQKLLFMLILVFVFAKKNQYDAEDKKIYLKIVTHHKSGTSFKYLFFFMF